MEKSYVSTTFLPSRFTLVKKRVPVKVNSKNKTGFSYGFEENPLATLNLFKKISSQLPESKGHVLIIGFKENNTSEVLEIIRSDINLKADFLSRKICKDLQILSRYRWSRMQLEEKGFVSLKIQFAHAA